MEPGQDKEGVGHSATLMLEPKVGEEGTQVGQAGGDYPRAGCQNTRVG